MDVMQRTLTVPNVMQRTRKVTGVMQRTLTVVASLLAHVAVVSAQFPGQTPRRRVDTPEERAACPLPTLEQCQSDDYLENDPCGMLQAQNDWTCADLLAEAADADTDAPSGELSIIAYNINPLGIDPDVRKYAAEPLVDQQPYYTPDLYAITSQSAAKNFAPSDDELAFDVYASWDNSTSVNSCTEYAYEKFFDQTVFERLVGIDQHDYRKVFQVAYGPGYQDQAIGSRHISDPLLRGFDNRPYAWMFTGAARPKNGFFALPLYASLPGRQPVQGAPSLALSLYGFNLVSPILFALMEANYGEVHESWAWHKEMSESLSVEGTPMLGLLAPGFDDPTSPLGYASPDYGTGDPTEEQLLEMTGPVPDDASGGKLLRRYLDAELDELYDKQLQLRRLVRAWARADVKYAGSGWTVAELHDLPPPSDEPSLGGLVLAEPLNLGGPGELTSGGDEPPSPIPTIPPQIKNPGPTPESLERGRILEEIFELYADAAANGCLEAGLTPCDWSPKLFARAVLHRFSNLRDAAFAKCDEYVPAGDFTPIKNLHVDVIHEPASVNGQPNPLADYNCTIATGSSITAAGLEQLFDDVDTCRELYPLYLEAKAALEAQQALEEARARVNAIPELIDPATGDVRAPGADDGAGEDKGNKYFGLMYDWGYGFAADYEANECDLQLFAGGHFELEAKVLQGHVEIIDALAEVSTDDRSLDVHARLLGINLFTPINESLDFGGGDKIEFGTTRDSDSGGDNQGVAAITIFIGPIPLKLQLGVAGSAGIDFDYGGFVQGFGLGGDGESNCPRAGIHAIVHPRVHIDGFVQASIDVGVAEAGVRGELLIANAETRFDASMALAFDPGNAHGLTFPKNLKLDIGTTLTASADTLEGNVKLYGRVGVCPFCTKAEKTLVAWDGYSYEREFFDQHYSVYLGDLLDAALN